jgi:hypothetical protein
MSSLTQVDRLASQSGRSLKGQNRKQPIPNVSFCSAPNPDIRPYRGLVCASSRADVQAWLSINDYLIPNVSFCSAPVADLCAT